MRRSRSQQALILIVVALQWWTARSRLGESAVVATGRPSGVMADVSSIMVNRGVFEPNVLASLGDDEGENDRKKNHSLWAGGIVVEHGWEHEQYGHNDEDYVPRLTDSMGGKKKEARAYHDESDAFSSPPPMDMDLHRNGRRSSSSYPTTTAMPMARPTRAPRVVFTGRTPTTTTTTTTTTKQRSSSIGDIPSRAPVSKRRSSSVGDILSRAPVSKRRSSSVDNTLARAPVAHPTQPPIISGQEL